MIKVYKPLFGRKHGRCVRVNGNSAEVWAELTCAMQAVFGANCQANGRKSAKELLELAVAQVLAEEPTGEKDGAKSE